MRFEVVRLQ